MDDEMAVVIDDENGAAADAGFLQAAQDAVEGDHGREHAAGGFADRERNGHDKGRAVIGAKRQRVTAEDDRLGGGGEAALQSLADKGVLVGAEVTGARALEGLTYGGEVKDIGVACDKILEQAS